MIKLDHIYKTYQNGHEALKDVSFKLDSGEMAFALGHSGAGKSTLFRLITLIEKPTSGLISVDGQSLNKLPDSKIPALRQEIGVIFQDHKLLYDRTVFDNVALPLVVIGMPHDEIKKRVRAALGKVGLAGKEKSLPITLSGGEQQRVGIARAVINRPNILLADEPTGNLDDDLSDEIIDIFADFNQVGVTVLIATHDMRQVERLNKRTLHLANGEIVQSDINKPTNSQENINSTANSATDSNQPPLIIGNEARGETVSDPLVSKGRMTDANRRLEPTIYQPNALSTKRIDKGHKS